MLRGQSGLLVASMGERIWNEEATWSGSLGDETITFFLYDIIPDWAGWMVALQGLALSASFIPFAIGFNDTL